VPLLYSLFHNLNLYSTSLSVNNFCGLQFLLQPVLPPWSFSPCQYKGEPTNESSICFLSLSIDVESLPSPKCPIQHLHLRRPILLFNQPPTFDSESLILLGTFKYILLPPIPVECAITLN